MFKFEATSVIRHHQALHLVLCLKRYSSCHVDLKVGDNDHHVDSDIDTSTAESASQCCSACDETLGNHLKLLNTTLRVVTMTESSKIQHNTTMRLI